jgi:hypothetical protein
MPCDGLLKLLERPFIVDAATLTDEDNFAKCRHQWDVWEFHYSATGRLLFSKDGACVENCGSKRHARDEETSQKRAREWADGVGHAIVSSRTDRGGKAAKDVLVVLQLLRKLSCGDR